MTAFTTTTSSSGRRKSAWELREEAKKTGWEQEEKIDAKINEPQHSVDSNKENTSDVSSENKNEKKPKKVWKRPKPGSNANLPPAFQMAFETHSRISKSANSKQQQEMSVEDIFVEVIDMLKLEEDDLDDDTSIKKVRFDKLHIKRIKCDYTHEERFAYWFQDHEFERMKKRDRSISKKIARGETNGRNYCTHGLMDDNYRGERRNRIEENWYNVLMEQDNQRQTRDVKRSNGQKIRMEDYCWDSISDLCQDVTQYDLELAQERALQHSIEMNVHVTKDGEIETDSKDEDDTITIVTTTTMSSVNTVSSRTLIDDMLEIEIEPACA